MLRAFIQWQTNRNRFLVRLLLRLRDFMNEHYTNDPINSWVKITWEQIASQSIPAVDARLAQVICIMIADNVRLQPCLHFSSQRFLSLLLTRSDKHEKNSSATTRFVLIKRSHREEKNHRLYRYYFDLLFFASPCANPISDLVAPIHKYILSKSPGFFSSKLALRSS